MDLRRVCHTQPLLLSLALGLGALPLVAGCGTDEADLEGTTTSELRQAEYPGVSFAPASPSDYTVGRQGAKVKYIVIHDTEGSYQSAIDIFENPQSQVSAHFVVRARDGAITQMVSTHDTAWHCGSWVINTESIGIEHEGFAAHPGNFTDAQYRASAKLVAELAKQYHVPIDRDHIVGHYQVVAGGTTVCSGSLPYSTCVGRNHGNHVDPGAGWDWTRYMGYVRHYAGQAANPPGPPAAGEACGAYSGYTLWNCDGTHQRFRCDANGTIERSSCTLECLSRPLGTNDVCAQATSGGACGARSAYTLWNCEAGTTLYKCESGTLKSYACHRGCSVRPVGQNDVCN